MTVTSASFRADFQEFMDPAAYPDASVNFWINVAVQMLNADRWGTLIGPGIELYVAHNLALGRMASKAAAGAGVPGLNSGPVNSKSVDKVSIGYDTSSGTLDQIGDWNLTTYGVRYMNLCYLIGAGGMQF